MKPLHVLIGGGTSWIARNLKQKLTEKGHKSTLVCRNPGENDLNWNEFFKDPSSQNAISLAAAKSNKPVDAVVSLSGAPLMDKPWTQARMAELRDSRILATERLVEHMRYADGPKPTVFVGTSATGIFNGIYHDKNNVYDENYIGPFGLDDFSCKICYDWEAASEPLEETSIRRVIIRVSPVLGKNGGIIPKMLIPGGIFCLGKLCSGEQWWPWIHIEDIANMFVHAIEDNSIHGTLNGVSPHCLTQAKFASILAQKSKRIGIPIPCFAIKFMFGERSPVLLEGANVIPSPKTIASSFKFKYPSLEAALENIFGTS